MTLSVPAQKYVEPSAMRAVQEEILDGLRLLPGVAYAGATTDLPMRSSGEQYAVAIPGLYEPSEAEAIGITRLPVSIDGFRALGLPLIRGRHFTAADGPDDPLAIIVNERMARDFFMGQDPIGRQVTSTSGTGGRTVVGIVADVRQRGPGEEPPPTFYVPMAQETPRPRISYIARSSGDPLALIDAMRNVVREVDPDLPVTDFVTLDQLSAEVTAHPRFLAAVMAGFAVLASLLAVLGVYGVLAHAVRSRTREIGLRCALGASRSEVMRQVFMEGMAPAVGGLAVGLAGAALLSRYLESLLFSVRPLDAATFGFGVAILAASAAVACIGPAVWAARVDPMVSLRGD
jgi:predicted permease